LKRRRRLCCRRRGRFGRGSEPVSIEKNPLKLFTPDGST